MYSKSPDARIPYENYAMLQRRIEVALSPARSEDLTAFALKEGRMPHTAVLGFTHVPLGQKPRLYEIELPRLGGGGHPPGSNGVNGAGIGVVIPLKPCGAYMDVSIANVEELPALVEAIKMHSTLLALAEKAGMRVRSGNGLTLHVPDLAPGKRPSVLCYEAGNYPSGSWRLKQDTHPTWHECWVTNPANEPKARQQQALGLLHSLFMLNHPDRVSPITALSESLKSEEKLVAPGPKHPLRGVVMEL